MKAQEKLPLGCPNASIRQENQAVPWIWQGVIALGSVTLLSAPEKTGKTALLSLLLDRRRAGGQLLGRAVAPGKTFVCTEEDARLWALRQPPLDFGPDVTFREPLSRVPNPRRWHTFIEDLLDRCLQEQEEETTGTYDLLVIDTAISFLPLTRRNKRHLQAALGQLRELSGIPVGVLIINQSRTVDRPLAAFADIVVRMSVSRTDTGSTRQRTFTGASRYPDPLPTVTAELNATGTDYILLPEAPALRPAILPIVQKLLAECPTPLTHRDLLARWPGAAPHTDSLWRALSRGLETRVLTATGGGTKTDPCRFALALDTEAPTG